MDSQITRTMLITITPPRKTASLADCTLCVVVFRTLNHFLLASRNNFEINILHEPVYLGEIARDEKREDATLIDDTIDDIDDYITN